MYCKKKEKKPFSIRCSRIIVFTLTRKKKLKSERYQGKYERNINCILHPCSSPTELPMKLTTNGKTVTGLERFSNEFGTLLAEMSNKTAGSVGNPVKSFKHNLDLVCTKSMALAPVPPYEILKII